MGQKDADDKSTISENSEGQQAPFVNEECGDTMWDRVLAEAAERMNKTFSKNPGESVTEIPTEKGTTETKANT